MDPISTKTNVTEAAIRWLLGQIYSFFFSKQANCGDLEMNSISTQKKRDKGRDEMSFRRNMAICYAE